MTLRILSYNILDGGEDRLPLITHLIQKQHPDAVALLEANNFGNAERLAFQLKMNLTFGEANSEYHLAWLSRSAPQQVKNHRLPILAKTLLEIDILWEADSITLFVTHLRAGHEPEHDSLRAQKMRAILDILHTRDNQPHVFVGISTLCILLITPTFQGCLRENLIRGDNKSRFSSFPGW